MSFFRSVFLCVVFGIARRAVFVRAFFLVPVLVNGEYPRRVAYGILGHGFVRDKPYALNDSVRAFDVYGTVGVDALFLLVPVNLFGEESFVLQVLDANVAPEPPQLQLVVEDGGVAENERFCVETGIEFLDEDALWKIPIGLVGFVEYAPLLGLYAVAGDSGVGNQRVDIEGRERRHVFGVAETVDNGFFLFFAGGEHRPQYHDREYEGGGELRNADGVSLFFHLLRAVSCSLSVSAGGSYRTTFR